MKHKRLYTGIIMAAAALGCLSSCKKDETLSEGPTVQMVLFEFNSGSTQKTYIGENYVPLWTDNDIVNVNGTTCPLTGIDGMRAEVTLPDQSGTYAAVYPAAAVIGELTSVGGSVEIPTLDGKAKVKIEPGTQPGKVLRLRGKGMPAVQGYGYGTGDIIVHVSVYVPETLSKEERQLIEKMQEAESFKPSKSIKEKIFQRFKSLFD